MFNPTEMIRVKSFGGEYLAVWHGRSRRKPTGGINHALRARMKRKYEMGREFVPPINDPTAEKEERKVVEGRSNIIKVRIRKVLFANVANPKTGEVKKVKILSVENNPANRHFSRIGVVTRGAVVKTELGLARVTSRPNQDGVVNAVLLE